MFTVILFKRGVIIRKAFGIMRSVCVGNKRIFEHLAHRGLFEAFSELSGIKGVDIDAVSLSRRFVRLY